MRRILLSVLLPAAVAGIPAYALPTMVRIGYPNCWSCHVAPQGAGLLNQYGRGIDAAQSLRGNDYAPSTNALFNVLNWNGKINQDLRTVMQLTNTSTDGHKAGTQVFRDRYIYRNVTEFGGGWRFTATGTWDAKAFAPRPTEVYDRPDNPYTFFANSAYVSYKPNEHFEVDAGRDALPTGINIADLSVFARARNRNGYYDSPTQVKAWAMGKRYQAAAYAFGPGGNEQKGFHEKGYGGMAEFDLLGAGRTVAGVNALRATSAFENRTLVAPYLRFGFGRSGVLAEYDMTRRTVNTTGQSFLQRTAYVQAFVAAKEWLVPSLIYEQLRVDNPYRERLDAVKLETSARLTSQLTITAGPRVQHDELTGRWAKSLVVQIAVKSAK